MNGSDSGRDDSLQASRAPSFLCTPLAGEVTLRCGRSAAGPHSNRSRQQSVREESLAELDSTILLFSLRKIKCFGWPHQVERFRKDHFLSIISRHLHKEGHLTLLVRPPSLLLVSLPFPLLILGMSPSPCPHTTSLSSPLTLSSPPTQLTTSSLMPTNLRSFSTSHAPSLSCSTCHSPPLSSGLTNTGSRPVSWCPVPLPAVASCSFLPAPLHSLLPLSHSPSRILSFLVFSCPKETLAQFPTRNRPLCPSCSLTRSSSSLELCCPVW